MLRKNECVELEVRVRKVSRLAVIGIPFARLHASGFPKAKADNSDQNGKREKLGEPGRHRLVLQKAAA